ncbi:MAG: PAS domain S-box protein [Pseudomonadota bacterium]|nr:PAS domain S-box protein [Pseudomonadota bacterium]
MFPHPSIAAKEEEIIRAVVENMLDAALLLDWDGTILFVNNTALRLMEMTSSEQIIGQNASQFVQPGSLARVVSDLEAVRSGQGGFLSQYLLRTAQGNDLWAEGLGTMITLGSRLLDLVILRDISARRRLETELRKTYAELEQHVDERTAELERLNRTLREEISERRRIEAELRESEEKFRKCAEAAPVGIFVYQGSRFLYLNPACESITGYSQDELLAMDIWELARPDLREAVRNRVERRQQGDFPSERYELVIIAKGGEERWLDTSATATEYRGRPAGLAVLVDITERKRAAAALKRSEERYRSFLDTLTDMIFITDRKGRLIYMNPAMEQRLGYPESMAGKLFTEIVVPEYRQEAVARYRRGMAGERVPIYEIEFLCADDVRIPVELNVTTYHDEDGHPAGRIGVARDIAERREEEKLFQIMARTSAAGVYIVQDGRFQYINPNAAAYAGYESEEMVGMESGSIVHPEDREKAALEAARMLRGESSHPYSFRVITKDGRIRWIMETLATIQYRGRRAILGNSMDVTERMEMERRLAENEVRYRSLFEGAGDGILILEKGRFTVCNRKALAIFQCREEDLLGRGLAHLSTPHQDDGGESKQQALGLLELAERGIPQFFEWRFRRKDGKPFFAEVHLIRIDIPGKNLIQCIVRDISDRKAAKAALQVSEERYRMIVENIEEGFYETDLEGNITFVNDAFQRIVGVDRREMLGSDFRSFASAEEAKKTILHFKRVLRTCQPLQGLVCQVNRPDGREQHLEISASLIRDAAGRPAGFRGLIRDVTERRRAEEKVQWIAYHDHLTGLPNRLLFRDRFTQLQLQAKRKDELFAVAVMDLDRFKEVNDRFGHAMGDVLLCDVSARLSQQLREGDTVARMGGDEFLFLLPGIRDRRDAAPLGEKIMQIFRQPFELSGDSITLTASIGMSVFPADGTDYDALLRRADQAMYQAKSEGGGVIVSTDP